MGWVGPEGRAASGSLTLALLVHEGPSRANAPWAVCDRLLVSRGHWFPGAAGCSWPVHPSEGSPAMWGRNPLRALGGSSVCALDTGCCPGSHRCDAGLVLPSRRCCRTLRGYWSCLEGRARKGRTQPCPQQGEVGSLGHQCLSRPHVSGLPFMSWSSQRSRGPEAAGRAGLWPPCSEEQTQEARGPRRGVLPTLLWPSHLAHHLGLGFF